MLFSNSRPLCLSVAFESVTSVESLSVHFLEEMAQIGRLVRWWIDDEVLAYEGLIVVLGENVMDSYR